MDSGTIDVEPGHLFLGPVEGGTKGEAARQGVTPDELAASTAEMWENGLAASGIGKDRRRAWASTSSATCRHHPRAPTPKVSARSSTGSCKDSST